MRAGASSSEPLLRLDGVRYGSDLEQRTLDTAAWFDRLTTNRYRPRTETGDERITSANG
jgi:hypothetical protein